MKLFLDIKRSYEYQYDKSNVFQQNFEEEQEISIFIKYKHEV